MNNEIVLLNAGRKFDDLHRQLLLPKMEHVDATNYLQDLTYALRDEECFYQELYSFLDRVLYGDELLKYRQYYKNVGMEFFSTQMVEYLVGYSKGFMLDMRTHLEDLGAFQQGKFPYELQQFTNRALLFKRIPDAV